MRISYSLTAIANAISAILIAAGTNVTKWAGSNVAAVNVAGYPLVDTHYHRGSAENVLQTGRRDVYVGSGFQQAAADLVWGTAARTLTSNPAIQSLNYYSGSISCAASFNGDKTVAITAVTVAKAVILGAAQFGFGAGTSLTFERISVSSTTVATFTGVLNSDGGASHNLIYGFWVLEFK